MSYPKLNDISAGAPPQIFTEGVVGMATSGLGLGIRRWWITQLGAQRPVGPLPRHPPPDTPNTLFPIQQERLPALQEATDRSPPGREDAVRRSAGLDRLAQRGPAGETVE